MLADINELPIPIIKTKIRDPLVEAQALAEGLDPMIAKIVSARALAKQTSIRAALTPTLRQLSSPMAMADMQKASERVAQAIIEKQTIGIETDHDCDGQSAHAVLYDNLLNVFRHPPEKIQSYIGHRLTEGYGLSQSVANRIMASTPIPQLLITADNGSSDEPRIKQLKALGMDVIVSDHHAIPKEGIPISAYACLNPTRIDCAYGDPYIAGCMVAWLLMAATRQRLIQLGYLPISTPTLSHSLDFVAVGTVADCVSIARSINNRIVVSYGLPLIEQGRRACWRAIKSRYPKPLTAEDLGFKVAPLLNSDGRLSDALSSVAFLVMNDDSDAMQSLLLLEDQNAQRKKIQQTIIDGGLIEAKKQVRAQRKSLCIYLEDGHTGVHGIAASRLKDLFGRPTVFLAPTQSDPHRVSGSVRGIEGFHVREALQAVADRHPTLLKAFGGHRAAGGLSFDRDQLALFAEAFEEVCGRQLSASDLGPVLWTDGLLEAQDLNLAFLDGLNVLEPFGREFDSPVFELYAELKTIRMIGDGTHARLSLVSDNRLFNGIWFKCKNAKDDPLPVAVGQSYRVVFVLKANDYQNKRTLDIQVLHMASKAKDGYLKLFL